MNPGFIFIETKLGHDLYNEDIPLCLKINHLKYNLLCNTIHEKGHFRAIFYLNNTFHLIDDLKKRHRKSTKIPNLKIITSFYYLE
jgi:hypothetical protein